MPLNIPCLNSPPCQGLADRLGGLCLDCQNLADNCPNCGRSKQALQVTPATVADVEEFWLVEDAGRWPEPATEKIRIVTVWEKGTTLRSKPTTESQAEQP